MHQQRIINKAQVLVLLLVLGTSLNADAFKFTERTCKDYGLGDSWYCEVEKKPESDFTDPETSADQILSLPVPPEQKAIMLNALWEVQTKRAVMTGDRADLKRFLETHRLIATKGVDFARNIQELIETTPAFSDDHSYLRNVAENVMQEEELKQTLLAARQRYAIVFVYKAGCVYCGRQLPILLALREKWGIQILGVSIDGAYYQGLDGNITDPNITQDPSVQAFPTIILLNKKSPRKIFISKGLTTLDQLEEKIFNRIKAEEDTAK